MTDPDPPPAGSTGPAAQLAHGIGDRLTRHQGLDYGQPGQGLDLVGQAHRRLARAETPIDRLVGQFDGALRALFGVTTAKRVSPAEQLPEALTALDDRRLAAALMRVNHSGEIAAQALYQGQALTARDPETRTSMQAAAQEEADHLAWCEARIDQLGGRTSLLNPLWYFGSFAIGAIAGLAGDRRSLGFLAETEQQVVQHLESHLVRLPTNDARSRAIVEQMRQDEAQHRDKAKQAGGDVLPRPITRMMQVISKLMTLTAFRI